MIHPLYTYGYLAGSLEELAGYASAGALILDIRINPTSRSPVWRQGHLRKVLGEAYDWCPDLGNPNYRSGGPVALANEEAGLPVVEQLLRSRPVVMLCACRDWRQCHRKLAAEAFQKRHPQATVVHLEPGEALDPPESPHP